jgi:hypothetical protein
VGSSPTDTTQQDSLPANAQEACIAPFIGSGATRWCRFQTGDSVCYAMSPLGDTAVLRLVI